MKRVHRQYKSGPSPIAQFFLFQHNLHTYIFLLWITDNSSLKLLLGLRRYYIWFWRWVFIIEILWNHDFSFILYKKAMDILELSVWNSCSWFPFTSLVPILVWYWIYWNGTESPLWPFAFKAPFILLIYSVSNLSFFNQTRTNLVCFICPGWFEKSWKCAEQWVSNCIFPLCPGKGSCIFSNIRRK